MKTTTLNEIRTMIVEFPERVSELRLSAQELEVFMELAKNYCRANPAKSRLIMSHLSIQHVSKLLFDLFKKGYAERLAVTSSTGGMEFEYWAVEDLADRVRR